MRTLDFDRHPHRRLNLLTGEWVLVSPHRTARPWQGQIEKPVATATPAYDPSCYMCPGNTRANGIRNPGYTTTFAFTNDFAALVPDTPADIEHVAGLLQAQGERGVCRVLCFSPRHDLTIARMSLAEIRHVVDLWIAERARLAARDDITYVQIFENRGQMMGASNPHPHGQIWASASLPNEIQKEQRCQQTHYERDGEDLLARYLRAELHDGTRVVCENGTFVAIVPFWGVWPFETMIIPRRRFASIDEMNEVEREGLADLLKRLLTRYDNLFAISFPYSMGFHEAPADDRPHPEWRWHGHVYPPLLRSATVRKFMVGYELLAMPQRDIPPEQAAERLRELSESHG
jgi:UDPglucose--hexose-1-phosphate uridylyltransferase